MNHQLFDLLTNLKDDLYHLTYIEFPLCDTMTSQFISHRIQNKKQKFLVPPIQFASFVSLENFNGTNQSCIHLFGGLTTDELSATFNNSTFVFFPKQLEVENSSGNKSKVNAKNTASSNAIGRDKRSLGTLARKTQPKGVSQGKVNDSNILTDLKSGWKKLPTHRGIEKRAFHSVAVRKLHVSPFSGKKASYSESLLLFGGSNGTTLLSDVWIFESSHWKGPISTKNAPDGIMSHTMVYSEELDSVLVFGGETKNRKSADVQILHCKDTWQWETIIPANKNKSEIITARSAHCSQLWKDEEMIIFGGDTEDDRQTNETWIFSISKQTWRKVEPKGDIPSPRSCASSAIWGDSMFIFGGFPYSNDCFEFDLIEERWRKISIDSGILPSPRSGAGLAILPEIKDGKKIPVMYIFGGRCYDRGDISDTNDLFKIQFPDEYIEDEEFVEFLPLKYNSKISQKVIDTSISSPQSKDQTYIQRFLSIPEYDLENDDITEDPSETTLNEKETIFTSSKLNNSNLKLDIQKSPRNNLSLNQNLNQSLDQLKMNTLSQNNKSKKLKTSSADKIADNLSDSFDSKKAYEILKQNELEDMKATYELKLSDNTIKFEAEISEKIAENKRLRQNFESSQKTISNLMEELEIEKKKRLELVELSKKQFTVESSVTSQSILDLKKELKNSEEEQASLFSECRKLQELNNSLSQQMKAKDEEIQALKEEFELDLQSKLQHIQIQEDVIDDHKKENELKFQEQKSNFENSISHLKEKLSKKNEKLIEKDLQIANLEAKISELELKLNTILQQKDDVTKLYELESGTSRDLVIDKENEIQQLVSKLEAAENTIQNFHVEKDQYFNESLTLREEISKAIQEVENRDKVISNLEQSLASSLEKISKLEQIIQASNQNISNLKPTLNQLEQLKVQYENLSKEYESYKKQKEIEEENQKLSSEEHINTIKLDFENKIKDLNLKHENEMNMIVSSHKMALTDLNTISLDRMHSSKKEIEELSSYLNKKDEEISSLKILIKEDQKSINKLNNDNENKMLEIDNLKNEIHALILKEKSLQDNLEEKNSESLNLKNIISDLEQNIKSIHSQHSKEIIKLETELENEKNSFDSKLKQETNLLESQFKNQIHQLEFELKRSKSEFEIDFENQRKEFEEKFSQEKKLLQDELKSGIISLETHLQEKILENSKLKRQISQLEQSTLVSDLRDEIENLNNQIIVTKKKYTQSLQEQDTLTNEMQQLQQRVHELNLELQSKGRQIEQLVSQLQDSNEKNVVSQKRILELMKEIDLFKTHQTELISSHSTFKQQKEEEFSSILNDLKLNHSNELEKMKHIIENLNLELSIQKKNEQNNLLHIQSTISLLKEDIEQKELELSRYKDQENLFREEIQNNKIQLNRQVELLKEKEQEIQWINVQKQLAIEEKSVCQSECKQLQKESIQLREANMKLTKELEAASEHISESSNQLKRRYEQKLESIKKEFQETRSNNENLETVMTHHSGKQWDSKLQPNSMNDINLSYESQGYDHSGLSISELMDSNIQVPRILNFSTESSPTTITRKSSPSTHTSSPNTARSNRSISSSFKNIEELSNQDRQLRNNLDERINQLKNSLTNYKESYTSKKSFQIPNNSQINGVNSSSSRISSNSTANTSIESIANSVPYSTTNSSSILNSSNFSIQKTNSSTLSETPFWKEWKQSQLKLTNKLKLLEEQFVRPLRNDRNIISLFSWTRLFNHFDTLNGSNKTIYQNLNSNNKLQLQIAQILDNLAVFESYCSNLSSHGLSTLEELEKDVSFVKFLQEKKFSIEEFRDLLLSPHYFVKQMANESHPESEDEKKLKNRLNQIIIDNL